VLTSRALSVIVSKERCGTNVSAGSSGVHPRKGVLHRNWCTSVNVGVMSVLLKYAATTTRVVEVMAPGGNCVGSSWMWM